MASTFGAWRTISHTASSDDATVSRSGNARWSIPSFVTPEPRRATRRSLIPRATFIGVRCTRIDQTAISALLACRWREGADEGQRLREIERRSRLERAANCVEVHRVKVPRADVSYMSYFHFVPGRAWSANAGVVGREGRLAGHAAVR